MVRGQWHTSRVSLIVLLFISTLLTACQIGQARDPHEVVYWTTDTGNIGIKAQRDVVRAFERANPDIHVKLVLMPGGTGNNTTLLTAVRGGTGPDVYWMDRFEVSQMAAIGLLKDLKPLIEKHDPGLEDQFLPFAWQETLYKGDPYALPTNTDDRALLYNKDVLRKAGVDPGILDPSHGPVTFDTIRRITLKVDHLNARGSFDRIGFIPWYDQGSPTTWAIAYGARFYNVRTCEVTPTEPAMIASLQFMYDWASIMSRNKVDTFFETFQPDNAPPSQNAFFSGQLAMVVTGNWFLQNIQEYAPGLNYGVTYLPVPHTVQVPYTWSGGFSLAIPNGAHNTEGAYRFMRFVTGPVGQRIITQETSGLPTWRALLGDRSLFPGNNEFFAQLLKFSHSRPPLPIWSELWDRLSTAQDQVVLHDARPEQALQAVYNHVQPQLQPYCPLT
jgi:ABC-type glycerol-3-phosphate transport system substrate-binding protein